MPEQFGGGLGGDVERGADDGPGVARLAGCGDVGLNLGLGDGLVSGDYPTELHGLAEVARVDRIHERVGVAVVKPPSPDVRAPGRTISVASPITRRCRPPRSGPQGNGRARSVSP